MDINHCFELWYNFQVNIIPVIGKSDACTKEELKTFKEKILQQLVEHEIDVYNFPADEGQQSLIPFAVVGSNVVVQDENGEDHDEPDVINDWSIIEI